MSDKRWELYLSDGALGETVVVYKGVVLHRVEKVALEMRPFEIKESGNKATATKQVLCLEIVDPELSIQKLADFVPIPDGDPYCDWRDPDIERGVLYRKYEKYKETAAALRLRAAELEREMETALKQIADQGTSRRDPDDMDGS